MKKILATTKRDDLFGNSHLLQCDICGENDRRKLIVEDLGIAVGMAGNNYSFCIDCWTSENFGEKLLELLERKGGIKYQDKFLELKEIE